MCTALKCALAALALLLTLQEASATKIRAYPKLSFEEMTKVLLSVRTWAAKRTLPSFEQPMSLSDVLEFEATRSGATHSDTVCAKNTVQYMGSLPLYHVNCKSYYRPFQVGNVVRPEEKLKPLFYVARRNKENRWQPPKEPHTIAQAN
jgi:hypothetical protein